MSFYPFVPTVGNVTIPLPIADGGTGQITAAAGLNALGGAAVAGDIGGTSASPQVVATHLSASLPIAQGGTGAATAGAALTALGAAPSGTDVNTSGQVTATHLAAALPIAQGGSGQTTQAAAMTALAGTQSGGKYLRSDGTNTALASIVAGDVPTLNQNTTGTAGGLSATLAIASGGTGQITAAAALSALGGAAVAGDIGGTSASPQITATHLASALPIAQGGSGQATAQAAMNAFAGAQTAGQFLRGNGTNVVMAAIAAGDAPAPNSNWPTANGIQAWTHDMYAGGGGNTLLVGGTIYLQMVQVHVAFTASAAWVAPQVAGSGATAGQNFLGLYTSGGTLLGSGGDDTLVTASAVKSVALTVVGGQSLALTAGSSYYVAILVNATVMPQYLRGTSSGALANFNSSIRAGTGGTTQTSLGNVTPGTANTPIAFWAGLS